MFILILYCFHTKIKSLSVAREIDVNENTLLGWVKKFSGQPKVKAVQTFSTEAAELRALQKELRDLMEENEILKLAMHYFAKTLGKL